MTLRYKCDDCGKSRKGGNVSGITAEVSDCLPNNWGLCHRDRFKPVEILCGDCFNHHRRH